MTQAAQELGTSGRALVALQVLDPAEAGLDFDGNVPQGQFYHAQGHDVDRAIAGPQIAASSSPHPRATARDAARNH